MPEDDCGVKNATPLDLLITWTERNAPFGALLGVLARALNDWWSANAVHLTTRSTGRADASDDT